MSVDQNNEWIRKCNMRNTGPWKMQQPRPKSRKNWNRNYISVFLIGILFYKLTNPQHYQMETHVVWYTEGEGINNYCIYSERARGSAAQSVVIRRVSYKFAFLLCLLVLFLYVQDRYLSFTQLSYFCMRFTLMYQIVEHLILVFSLGLAPLF